MNTVQSDSFAPETINVSSQLTAGKTLSMSGTKNRTVNKSIETTKQVVVVTDDGVEATMKVSDSSEWEHIEDTDSVVTLDSSEDEYDSDDEEEEELDEFLLERKQILADARKLKTVAEFYYAPEKPVVVTDATACARCFFDRVSAPEQESVEMLRERKMALQDATNLKTTAEWYLQPEKPVACDGLSSGRDYFRRPSAEECEDDDDLDIERERILQDMKQLKKLAVDYLQPERPVTVDAECLGRNYFSRASAPEYNDEDALERERIMQDLQQLKTTAEWYLQPEKPVVTSDATACGRNYFTRASAPEYEEEVDMEERNQVLAEAAALKKIARWHMHPEEPVVCEDPCATARNYYTRASAPEYEEDEDMMIERKRVLAEAAEMKKRATWYLHPENPVVCDDPCATGRNFFSRPSAPEYEEDEDLIIERERVLAEAKSLKQVAEWYHCPEKPVETDALVFGRNYFSRSSAPEQDLEAEERESILADAMNLKQTAEWYHCPEKPVEVDPTACARNYFSRASAPEYEVLEDDEERRSVLADANKLKEVAKWYHHPEAPVTSSVNVARDFFSRPSAEEHIETMEEEEERARVLSDALQLKKLAVDYLHPENPVVSSINCVRNFFDRPSAPNHADHIHSEGHAINASGYLQDHHVEMHHYDDYHHYDYSHHDDDHSHHTAQSDHFEMDEDQFLAFRQSVQEQVHAVPIIKETEGDEKEGNLSRSPSSVMLFDESAM